MGTDSVRSITVQAVSAQAMNDAMIEVDQVLRRAAALDPIEALRYE